ncbi:MAG: YwiC-like family protein [Myxococcales bacterium]|nr:YwiC-like family protein [Myxococcales bacterium]
MEEARRRPQKGPPSLWPKEHGAYAEMAFPLLTGLALGRPKTAGLLMVVAAVIAFVLHEALLVAVGLRGRRVGELLGAKARRRLLVGGTVVVAAAVGGIALADDATRQLVAVPGVLALGVLGVVVARREKTTPGETLVAATFSAALLPVAAASGVALAPSIVAAVSWLFVFLLGTFTVRLTLERARKEPGPMRFVSPFASAVALATAGYALQHSLAAIAVIPTACMTLWWWWRPVSPKRLKAVGWSLVAGNLFAFTVLVVTLR